MVASTACCVPCQRASPFATTSGHYGQHARRLLGRPSRSFFFFFADLFATGVRRSQCRSSSDPATLRQPARYRQRAPSPPARIGKDLMQGRHGPLAQLGGRGEFEERGCVGALGSDSQQSGPAGDPGGHCGGPQLPTLPDGQQGGAGIAPLRYQTCRQLRRRRRPADNGALGPTRGMSGCACGARRHRPRSPAASPRLVRGETMVASSASWEPW